jgi:hypothetical protein
LLDRYEIRVQRWLARAVVRLTAADSLAAACQTDVLLLRQQAVDERRLRLATLALLPLDSELIAQFDHMAQTAFVSDSNSISNNAYNKDSSSSNNNDDEERRQLAWLDADVQRGAASSSSLLVTARRPLTPTQPVIPTHNPAVPRHVRMLDDVACIDLAQFAARLTMAAARAARSDAAAQRARVLGLREQLANVRLSVVLGCTMLTFQQRTK